MINGKTIVREGTEEFNLIKQEWYDAARVMKVEDLEKFVKHLTEDYIHDYGTICHAMSIASIAYIAAMWAVDHTESGGITGFQAGCVMWENIKNWMTEYRDVPLRLVNYRDMLYPQYESKYQKILSDKNFEWLQKEVVKNLADTDIAHPDVIAHWQTIADGSVPFGYVLQSVVDAERREAEKDFIRIEENPQQPEEIVKNGENEDGLCQC